MKYSSSFTHDLNFGEIAENWLNILFKDVVNIMQYINCTVNLIYP